MKKKPPSIKKIVLEITLNFSIPSGTKTNATAESKAPQPKAITPCLYSFSIQAVLNILILAIEAPKGIANPANNVNMIIVKSGVIDMPSSYLRP